jgi:adenosine deaminase
LIQSITAVESLPKVDIHRHLEGSLRLTSLAEIVEAERLPLPGDSEALRQMVQITGDQVANTGEFLAKFKTIRRFFRSKEIIQRFTEEAIEDASRDNVRALELRFTPFALAQEGRFELEEVIEWVIAAAHSAGERYTVEVACVVSVNRHEPVKIAERVIDIALERTGDGVTGIDLAGDEAAFHASPFESVFMRAKEGGLGITVHAGEWGGVENVRHAVEHLYADRIGHGIRVLEDPEIAQEAARRGIVFEVSPSSNWKTGAIEQLASHPIAEMIQVGLALAITTDDPAIFELTLSSEFSLAMQKFDFSIDSVKAFNLTALRAMFLPARAKKRLEKELIQSYWGTEASVAADR